MDTTIRDHIAMCVAYLAGFLYTDGFDEEQVFPRITMFNRHAKWALYKPLPE